MQRLEMRRIVRSLFVVCRKRMGDEIIIRQSLGQGSEINSPVNAKQNDQRQPTESSKGTDETWIGFSDLNRMYFSTLLGMFSVFTSLISHPFTVISVRQQVDSSLLGDLHHQQSMGTVVRGVVSRFGPIALFRGFLPMATLGPPSNVIYFSSIESSRETLQPIVLQIIPSLSPEGIEILQAGCSSVISNFISLIPYVPAEVVSSRIIVSPQKVGMTEMCKNIYHAQGIKGFFKGFNSSFAVCVTSGFQWWWMYALCRRLGLQSDFGKTKPLLIEAVSGCFAGLSAVAVSYPIDTIKTRIMSSSHGPIPTFRKTFQQVVKKDGYKALYRGLPASLSQAALGSTIFATCYETIKNESQRK